MDSHVLRVENSVELGTPDVNLCVKPRCAMLNAAEVQEHGLRCEAGHEWRQYRESSNGWSGWIELKVQEPPKRRGTTFRCSHFTMEQRQWLVKRVQAGGKAYMLLQAGRRYLFIRGDIAAVWIGECTLTELVEKSDWTGDSLLDLVEHLHK